MKSNWFLRFVAAFIFAFLSFVVATVPQTRAQEALADAISKAGTIIQTTLVPKSPGLAVAVAVNGAIVWSEGFGYSSYNWNVIGVVMESAAKQDFLHYMEEHVFKPLRMSNTGPDLAGATDPQRTQFYETDSSGKFIIAPRVDCSSKWPSGGFLSTANDLVRFGSSLLAPGFLKPQSLKLLFTSQRTVDGKLTHYGVGWFIGRTVVYHPGDAVGGTSILLLLPSSGTAVAILCNRGSFVIDSQLAHPFVAQKTALHLAVEAAALRIARIFAPLSTKP